MLTENMSQERRESDALDEVDVSHLPDTTQEEMSEKKIPGKGSYSGSDDVEIEIENMNNIPSGEEDRKLFPWEVSAANHIPWSRKTNKQRAVAVGKTLLFITLLVGLLYLFIISLDLLGSAFKILGGPTAGRAFRESDILDNPIAGLALGILTTVLVQSSSTSTSIVVSMTASNIITIDQSVPIIMGANIGTSVTNTIVAVSHIADKDEFRRAFSGATVHDMFNMLSVCVILPINLASKYLQRWAEAVVDTMNFGDKEEKVKILKKLTEPLTKLIVRVNKKLITKIAEEDDPVKLDELESQSMLKDECCYLFYDTGMSDAAVGSILLIVSLIMLCGTLIGLVKLLTKVFQGRAGRILHKAVNLKFRKGWDWLSGYILILVGAGITICVQSSSVMTSVLTPLVGIGMLQLEKMYPLTLGANIGTTVTAILAALATSNVETAMTVAFVHLFFNVSGIILWYPIPFMRHVPIRGAQFLGDFTADHRWFPIVYIVIVFLCIPAFLFALSLGGLGVFLGVLLPLLFIFFGYLFVVWMQRNHKESLPEFIRDRKITPNWDYVDNMFAKIMKKKNESKQK
eukprot:Nk52_evm31s243 gene=Nk52_evmTU31s243